MKYLAVIFSLIAGAVFAEHWYVQVGPVEVGVGQNVEVVSALPIKGLARAYQSYLLDSNAGASNHISLRVFSSKNGFDSTLDSIPRTISGNISTFGTQTSSLGMYDSYVKFTYTNLFTSAVSVVSYFLYER